MTNRILPTSPQGWFALMGICVGVMSGVAGSVIGSHAWLLATIEHTHVSLLELDRQITELEADIYLIDKQLEGTGEGELRDALLERRVQKYSELDRLNGL